MHKLILKSQLFGPDGEKEVLFKVFYLPSPPQYGMRLVSEKEDFNWLLVGPGFYYDMDFAAWVSEKEWDGMLGGTFGANIQVMLDRGWRKVVG